MFSGTIDSTTGVSAAHKYTRLSAPVTTSYVTWHVGTQDGVVVRFETPQALTDDGEVVAAVAGAAAAIAVSTSVAASAAAAAGSSAGASSGGSVASSSASSAAGGGGAGGVSGAGNLLGLVGQLQFAAMVGQLAVNFPTSTNSYSANHAWANMNFKPPWKSAKYASTDDSAKYLATTSRRLLSISSYAEVLERSAEEQFADTVFYVSVMAMGLIAGHLGLLEIIKKYTGSHVVPDAFDFPKVELFFLSIAYPGVCLSACNVWHYGSELYIVMAVLVIIAFPLSYCAVIYSILKNKLHSDDGAVFVPSKYQDICRPLDEEEKDSIFACSCLGDVCTLVCVRIQQTVDAAVYYGAWVPGEAPGSEQFAVLYSPLYGNYRKDSAYFALFDMSKVLVTCFLVGAFGSTTNAGATVQAIMVFLVFAAYLVMLIWRFPYRDRLENVFQILTVMTQLCVLLVCVMMGVEGEQGSDAQGTVMDTAMNIGTALLIFASFRAAFMNVRDAVDCDYCCQMAKDEFRETASSLGADMTYQELRAFGTAKMEELMDKLKDIGIDFKDKFQIQSVSSVITDAFNGEDLDTVIDTDGALDKVGVGGVDGITKVALDASADMALDGLAKMREEVKQAFLDKMGCSTMEELTQSLAEKAMEKIHEEIDNKSNSMLKYLLEDEQMLQQMLQKAVHVTEILEKATLMGAAEQIVEVQHLLEKEELNHQDLKKAAEGVHKLSATLTEDGKADEAGEVTKLANLLDEAVQAESKTNADTADGSSTPATGTGSGSGNADKAAEANDSEPNQAAAAEADKSDSNEADAGSGNADEAAEANDSELNQAAAATEADNSGAGSGNVDKVAEDDKSTEKDKDVNEPKDYSDSIATLTIGLLDFFLDAQTEMSFADRCSQFDIQVFTKEQLEKVLTLENAVSLGEHLNEGDPETEEPPSQKTLADVGLDACTPVGADDIQLSVQVSSELEQAECAAKLQDSLVEKAAELLQDLQADVVCWLANESDWPPSCVEDVLRYEPQIQEKLVGMRQELPKISEQLQQVATDFATDSDLHASVDLKNFVTQVMDGPVDTALKQTENAIEAKMTQFKRELPDTEADRPIRLPSVLSCCPTEALSNCLRKWECSAKTTLTIVAALYALVLSITCVCLVTRGWFDCTVSGTDVSFGLGFGLYHNGDKIVDYTGDFEKEANTSASLLIFAVASILPGLAILAIPVCGLAFQKYTVPDMGKHFTCGKKSFDIELSLDAITRNRFYLVVTLSNLSFTVFAFFALAVASSMDFSGCSSDPGAALYIMWIVWVLSFLLIFSWVLPFASRGSDAIWPPANEAQQEATEEAAGEATQAENQDGVGQKVDKAPAASAADGHVVVDVPKDEDFHTPTHTESSSAPQPVAGAEKPQNADEEDKVQV
jgi:hypothetical protein